MAASDYRLEGATYTATHRSDRYTAHVDSFFPEAMPTGFNEPREGMWLTVTVEPESEPTRRYHVTASRLSYFSEFDSEWRYETFAHVVEAVRVSSRRHKKQGRRSVVEFSTSRDLTWDDIVEEVLDAFPRVLGRSR